MSSTEPTGNGNNMQWQIGGSVGRWDKGAANAKADVETVQDMLRHAALILALELLQDIRGWFNAKENPEYLPTRDLMELLIALEFRPWSAWKPSAAGRLARLLHPFGIYSHNMYTSPDKYFRGYLLKDFQDVWERYLPPLTVPSGVKKKPL